MSMKVVRLRHQEQQKRHRGHNNQDGHPLRPLSYTDSLEAKHAQIAFLVEQAHATAASFMAGHIRELPRGPVRLSWWQPMPPGMDLFEMCADDFGGIYHFGDAIVGLMDRFRRPVELVFNLHLENGGKTPARDVVLSGVLNMAYVGMNGGVGTYIQASPDVAFVIYAIFYPTHVADAVLHLLPAALIRGGPQAKL